MENIKEFLQGQIDRLLEISEDMQDADLKLLAKEEADFWQEALSMVEEYESSEPAWTDPTDIIAAGYDALAVIENIQGDREKPNELTEEQKRLVDEIRGNALGLCSFATDKLWDEMRERLKWEKDQRAKKKQQKKEGEK